MPFEHWDNVTDGKLPLRSLSTELLIARAFTGLEELGIMECSQQQETVMLDSGKHFPSNHYGW